MGRRAGAWGAACLPAPLGRTQLAIGAHAAHRRRQFLPSCNPATHPLVPSPGPRPRPLAPGKVEVTPDLAQELLEVADQYMLETLKHLCEQAITDQLAPDNVSAAYDLADNYNAPELSKQCALYCLREQPEMVKGGSKTTPASYAIVMQVRGGGVWGWGGVGWGGEAGRLRLRGREGPGRVSTRWLLRQLHSCALLRTHSACPPPAGAPVACACRRWRRACGRPSQTPSTKRATPWCRERRAWHPPGPSLTGARGRRRSRRGVTSPP